MVQEDRGRLLGTFHYSSSSQITLRQLSSTVDTVDADFFRRRIEQAVAFRARVVRDSNACRLVFSEADFLPGLIVDRYGSALTVQTLTQAMDRAKETILSVLTELLQPTVVISRNDAAVRRHEELPQNTAVEYGEWTGPVTVTMNGLTYEVDLLHGQKTGIYLDQRENYLAAGVHGHGHALDCFTSTGGFALHLARRCESVQAVDSSAAALATARENAQRNSINRVEWREADAFDLLAANARAGKRFNTVVLDPPAFAKTRNAIDGALRGYRDINYRALRILEPNGILVTCSCSHHISEADLLGTVAAAALDARRRLRVLERRTQASDHPILLHVPETLYLKCLIFEVL